MQQVWDPADLEIQWREFDIISAAFRPRDEEISRTLQSAQVLLFSLFCS